VTADAFDRTALLIATLARRLPVEGHVVVGAISPVPAAAALLAQGRAGDALRVTILGSTSHYRFTDGGRELFDAAGTGRVDAFFLSGGQIDGQANINLVAAGDYARPATRFPGSFGSSYLYFVVPNVILFREEHSPRVLVEKVDFISAPGTSPPGVWRPGGPRALVTGRAVFAFDRARARFTLESVHPGETPETIAAATGFDFDRPETVPVTPAPSADELAAIRGPVRATLSATYPRFAARLGDADIAAEA
jgi:glutaconate CoA-transferase subunit B